MNIDLGGGTKPRFGCINLDPVHGEGEWKRRIQDGIPVPDDSVVSVWASHVVEHIPAGTERIAMFNEVWRVLKPGGQFTVITPKFPNWRSVADPTHVSYWVPESFDYFDGTIKADAEYDIRLWSTVAKITRGDEEDDWELVWVGSPAK